MNTTSDDSSNQPSRSSSRDSRKRSSKNAKSQGPREKKRYYHVHIQKLAQAFENQFFSTIQQIEALDDLDPETVARRN